MQDMVTVYTGETKIKDTYLLTVVFSQFRVYANYLMMVTQNTLSEGLISGKYFSVT